MNKDAVKLKITDVASLKRWLSMYDNLKREIACQSERLYKLQEKIGTVGSPSFSGMPSNPSETNDRRADVIAAVIDLQKEVNGLYEYYEKLTADLEWCVRYMPVPEERAVIRTRYIDSMEWDEITEVIFNKEPDYNEKFDSYKRRIYLIHGTALKKLAEVAAEQMK